MIVSHSSLNPTPSPKTATDSTGPKVGNSTNETQHPWYRLIDRKHYFLHVKFEVRFVTSFARNSMPSKKWHFSWGMMLHPFFFQNAPSKKSG
jgi:hypothetical protein